MVLEEASELMDHSLQTHCDAIAAESGVHEKASLFQCAEGYSVLVAANEPNAMVRLGVLLEEYPQLCEQYGAANRLFEKAATHGHPRGYYNLARYYYDHAKYEAAVEKFLIAVSLGDATSFVYLGMCYEHGNGVIADVQAAFSCYRSAALLGELHGVLRLSSLCRQGHLSSVDLAWVFHCLDCFVRRNRPEAAFEAGMLLLGGQSPPDGTAFCAFEYMKRAADGGLDEAQRWVGEAYLCDLYVSRNYASAAHYLSLAVEAGNAEAMHRYACLYLKGDGVPKDLAKARHLFQEAAEKGNKVSVRLLELWDDIPGK